MNNISQSRGGRGDEDRRHIPMSWRPQYSIRSILILTTVVAVATFAAKPWIVSLLSPKPVLQPFGPIDWEPDGQPFSGPPTPSSTEASSSPFPHCGYWSITRDTTNPDDSPANSASLRENSLQAQLTGLFGISGPERLPFYRLLRPSQRAIARSGAGGIPRISATSRAPHQVSAKMQICPVVRR